jgi:methylmalonyl-CoA epimerase
LRGQDTIDAAMRILRIRHLTLAVRDLDAARAAFASLFGAEASDALAVEAFGARTQDVALGESTLQLASPVDRDGALQRFIERRGEGVYTVALEVDDLDAAVAELASKGVRVSDPVEAAPGLRTAFVTALATHGMSVQLVGAVGARAENLTPRPPSLGGKGEATGEETMYDTQQTPSAEDRLMPPKRALDLTPDEWEEWSDTD